MRAQNERSKFKKDEEGIAQMMNFENFLKYKGDLTERSSIATTITPRFMNMKHKPSISQVEEKLNADIEVEVEPEMPKQDKNFLQVPNRPFLGSRMEQILKKKTRLLERQKTKQILK